MGDAPKDRTDNIYTSIIAFPPQGAKSTILSSDLIRRKRGSAGTFMEEMILEGAISDGARAPTGVPSPVRNSCNVDLLSVTSGAGGEQTLWPDLAVSHTPQITGFHRGPEGTNSKTVLWPDKAFPSVESAGLGSKESIESLTGEATSTSDYMKDKQPSFRMETQGPELDCPSDLLHSSASNSRAGAEEMRLPEDPSEHFPYPPNDMFYDHSADFAGSLPLIAKIKADPTDLASLVGEGVVNSALVDCAHQPSLQLKVFREKVVLHSAAAESPSWFQSSLPDSKHQETVSLCPVGISSTSSAYSTYAGVLPHRVCYICGDEASGCHYGVLTCGSCKVFFKRAVEGHQKYLCAGRNDCIVDKIRRKNCPACRLRKCYQAGMMLGGRKLKKFGVLKPMGLTGPSGLGLYCDGQDVAPVACVPTIRELRASPQIINILENIEPEVVYSGHDNSQPDLPHHLLTSLNRLCERQLLWIVKWSKLLPGFRNLHINDQMCLIQYSWMNLMLFSLGWRSFKNVTREYLYFAPDLVMNEDRMKQSPIADLCTAMQLIPREFANLHLSREEFLCMKALLLLATVPLEGLKSQEQFAVMRQKYIQELTNAIQWKEPGAVGSSQRFYRLTKLMDTMHEIAKKVNLYCLNIFIQAEAMRVEFPEMMSEVIASQLPKILAGMVKPLLFHGKQQ
ncbi:progesterone receptor-like [Arapaima gigas]